MNSIYVIRILGWKALVFQLFTLQQIGELYWRLLGRFVRSSIFREIMHGSDEKVLRLATSKRLKRARGRWGESPLVATIAEGRTELAILLIQRGGAYVNDGSLAQAAMRGDIKVVEALILNGKYPDEPLPDGKGVTPLMWATNRKFFCCMEKLLEAGANVDLQQIDGTTAVMYTRAGNVEELKALEILCRYKPDISIKDWRGRNLIKEALDRQNFGGNPAMRTLLEKFFPEIDFTKF